MSIDERLRVHHDRKMDLFNNAVTAFRDAALLNEKECDAIIAALNIRLLCETGNNAAQKLRSLLSLAVDVQRTEDALAGIRACSRDTDGDGNCGRPHCPECKP